MFSMINIKKFRNYSCKLFGHKFEMNGGRRCPKISKDGHVDCSQPVFQCKRCGLYSEELSEKYCKDCDE